MSWSATQYTKFEFERTRAVRDLLAHVVCPGASAVVDLGCGPGNSTELLVERFPGAVVTGVDSSTDMIESARRRLPSVGFEVGDITEWSRSEGRFDVILANASLQWVPDHATLLPRLLAKLLPGGVLAVQVPDNQHEPSHRLMGEAAASGPWAAKLAGAAGVLGNRQTADWYFRTLDGLGARVDLWRTTYLHVLEGGAHAIVEWFKSTGLRPFLEPLDAEERVGFLARYEEMIGEAYPTLGDGRVLLPFPRLFFVATVG